MIKPHPNPMSRSFRAFLCLPLCLGLLAGSENTIAQEAITQEAITHQTGAWLQDGNPQGRWKGRWQSESTGHSGPMNVSITPTAKGTYQARFTGRFALVIPFAYRAELVPQTTSEGQTVLSSSKKLGPILGSYQMQTQVTGDSLSGGFQAAGDRGSIKMRRVR
jgi:hypothetical protein